ncbi:hypothetical protein [Streptomyces sp. NPDC051994]|uniref:hypothetical protein n=1 Tax=unclassified Streptomyces TaxID=2593676 RepID=UPI0034121B71
MIDTQVEAERLGFTGSPTILVNGRDPFAESGRTPRLTCRGYGTPDGWAGVPTVDQLRQALRAVAEQKPGRAVTASLPPVPELRPADATGSLRPAVSSGGRPGR